MVRFMYVYDFFFLLDCEFIMVGIYIEYSQQKFSTFYFIV